jgi:rRNA maturation protein Nop10
LAYKQKQNDVDVCNENGIYALKCPDCGKRYLRQTGIPFRTRFRKHFSSYKQRNYNSNFAQHLLENNNSMAPVNEIMEVVQVVKKNHFVDILEKYYIYKETCMNNQLNEQSTQDII